MVGEYTKAEINPQIYQVYQTIPVNINGMSYADSEWLINDLNIKVLKLLFPGRDKSIDFVHKKFTLSEGDIESFGKPYSFFSRNYNGTYSVCIWHISNGYTKIKNLDNEYADEKAASMLLQKDAKHIIRVIKQGSVVQIFTSKYDWDFIRKVIALLPKLFPDLENPKLNELLLNLGIGNLDKAEEIADKMFEQLNIIEELFNLQFIKLKESLTNTKIKSLEKNIADLRHRIENLERDITDKYNSITGYNDQIFLIQTKGTTFIDELIRYLSKHKLISINEVNDDNLSIRITAPLRYFDPAVMEKYMARSVPEMVSDPFTKDFLTKLFISCEYELITYVDVAIYFQNNRIDTLSHHSSVDFYPHPHLMGFNCWGNNKSLILKALSELDYIGACEQIIAASYNLNLLDNTVLRNFMTNIKSTNYRHLKTIRIKATNEIISYEMLKNKFKEGESNETN